MIEARFWLCAALPVSTYGYPLLLLSAYSAVQAWHDLFLSLGGGMAEAIAPQTAVSNSVLPWLMPFFLLAVFIPNAFLLGRGLYQALSAAQLGFYALTTCGAMWRGPHTAPYVFSFPHYITATRAAFLAGFARACASRPRARWRTATQANGTTRGYT